MLTATPAPRALFHPSSPPSSATFKPEDILFPQFQRRYSWQTQEARGIGYKGWSGVGCSAERTVGTRKRSMARYNPPLTTHSHTKLLSPAYRASAHLTAAVFKSLLRCKLHSLNLRPAISLLSRVLLL